ncbi:tonB-system energizer ExbB [Pseudomonas turukhanskensis]|uniref:Biopolymer transport protein ExbB n=1 Tax=Pseudomonas turukhanskensis TaxID=1806536 RepID=A0A9W6K553_9PSED|nr:tonB-system energizer ExbB [Pseudomonas turukhanskensis]GLK87143.1 tonB-system energizer ExbB [Pseudomonas turukhanskensis]
MNFNAYRAQPSLLQPRALLACGALLLSLMLPASSFAEETTAPAAAPAATAPAPADATGAVPAPQGETPAAAALREKIAALGPDATPEQISTATKETLEANGASPEEVAQALDTLQKANDLIAEDQENFASDLSPWGMYQNADHIVKAVMIGLALASVITWTIWIAKGLELLGAKRRLRAELALLKQSRSLKEASDKATKEGSLSHVLVHDALEEMRLSANTREKEGIKERVSFRLERLVAACGREMSQGTGVLATIGSTAPFFGLFGTVWGIMNSFIGIAKSQTTNLAVVAPGIAEALLATAMGLVAAIPAVVIYNVFARSITGYKAQVADASAQVLLLVSRDLDHLPAERSQPHAVKVS